MRTHEPVECVCMFILKKYDPVAFRYNSQHGNAHFPSIVGSC